MKVISDREGNIYTLYKDTKQNLFAVSDNVNWRLNVP